MFKSGLILSATNITATFLGLLRNVLIARLISVEDFGIASTFAIAMSLVEMTSNIALDRLIIQARDGDKPMLQATAQAINAARGAIGAVVLFLAAEPLARFFGIPEIAWTYQLLALTPLIRGLAHLDLFRLQREMLFASFVRVELASQGLSTIAAVMFSLWLTDYRAMLYTLLLQQVIFTIATHTIAGRPYQWAWERAIVRRAIDFGWPLLVNSLLMFGIFTGDQFIVGSLIGMTELGWFSAAFALTLSPSIIVTKTLQSFFLPQLSKLQDEKDAFCQLATVTMQAAMLAGIVYLVLLVTVGSPLFITLYGSKYEPALAVFLWLAVMQCFRIAKAGPICVAVSKGKTTNPLIANTMRLLMFPCAALLVLNGSGMVTVVYLGIAGELLAFFMSIFLVRLSLRSNKLDLSSPILAFIVLCALTMANFLFWTSPSATLQFDQLILVLPALVAYWTMRSFRNWAKEIVRPLRVRLEMN